MRGGMLRFWSMKRLWLMINLIWRRRKPIALLDKLSISDGGNVAISIWTPYLQIWYLLGWMPNMCFSLISLHDIQKCRQLVSQDQHKMAAIPIENGPSWHFLSIISTWLLATCGSWIITFLRLNKALKIQRRKTMGMSILRRWWMLI